MGFLCLIQCIINTLFLLVPHLTLCYEIPLCWNNKHFLCVLRCNLPNTLQWRHNGRDSVSYHQPRERLLNRLIRCGSKKVSKLRVTGLCAGNSPETGELPAQRASNAENVSIWWRHHEESTEKHLLAWWHIYPVSWSSAMIWVSVAPNPCQ